MEFICKYLFIYFHQFSKISTYDITLFISINLFNCFVKCIEHSRSSLIFVYAYYKLSTQKLTFYFEQLLQYSIRVCQQGFYLLYSKITNLNS